MEKSVPVSRLYSVVPREDASVEGGSSRFSESELSDKGEVIANGGIGGDGSMTDVRE